MTTLLRAVLDLPMNACNVLHLAFRTLFLNEGHTVHK